MNAVELAKNPRLASFFVRNLNKEPDGWAMEDDSLDAVTCCVRWEERGGEQGHALLGRWRSLVAPGCRVCRQSRSLCLRLGQ